MNVGQITMPVVEARRRLRAYRKSVHTAADVEYQAAERAYAALARGTPIVVLSQAFALAKLDAKGRPLMAIARADEKQVEIRCSESRYTFEPARYRVSSPYMRARTRIVSHNRGVVASPGYALVPMVPPDVRGNRSLEKHWILWEVEQWADQMIRMRPDRDPLLLRHLGGEAYAVVGQWDLTEVERAIMAGTRALGT